MTIVEDDTDERDNRMTGGLPPAHFPLSPSRRNAQRAQWTGVAMYGTGSMLHARRHTHLAKKKKRPRAARGRWPAVHCAPNNARTSTSFNMDTNKEAGKAKQPATGKRKLGEGEKKREIRFILSLRGPISISARTPYGMESMEGRGGTRHDNSRRRGRKGVCKVLFRVRGERFQPVADGRCDWEEEVPETPQE